MVSYDPKSWLRVTFSLRGTVLPRVLGRTVLLAAFTMAVWAIWTWWVVPMYPPPEKPPSINTTAHTIMGVAVGLLIVFRNNCSYDRYWEGRKLWGSLVNASRNLVREAAAFVGTGSKEVANLVAAYAFALKQHLRSNKDLSEIEPLVSKEVMEQAGAAANPPSIIALHMTAWIQKCMAAGKIDSIVARGLESYVSAFLDNQGGCERILRTPIPFAYAVHIKQLLMLYLFTLPIVLVPLMDWGAALAVSVIAFGLLGIEEAGVEIEDPFGDDPNDLPVESICAVIARDATALAQLGEK